MRAFVIINEMGDKTEIRFPQPTEEQAVKMAKATLIYAMTYGLGFRYEFKDDSDIRYLEECNDNKPNDHFMKLFRELQSIYEIKD